MTQTDEKSMIDATKAVADSIDHAESCEWEYAFEVLNNSIEEAKRIFHQASSEEIQAISYGTAILLKAFQDYYLIEKNTTDTNWVEEPKLVEAVWGHICDCRERTDAISTKLEHPAITWLQEHLEKVEDKFAKNFGPGKYVSPEIECSEPICNICGQEASNCNHLPGEIVNGNVCRYTINKIKDVHSVAIVDNPKDRRCRIWPWNFKKPNLVTVCVLTTHTFDGFLFDQ